MDAEAFAIELNVYLQERYKLKRPPAVAMYKMVTAKRSGFDLYFRCLSESWVWPDKTLVIARISFAKMRKGYGRSLLNLIADHSQRHGYEHIALECTNVASKAFGSKFGFKPYRSKDNFLIALPDLQAALAG